MKGLSDTKTLSNGVKIPIVGYGSWRTPAGKICVDGVKCAIENGYRLIDTAAVYENERSVGEGIKESGIKREDLFVTTKLWNTDQGYESALKAFDISLKKLQLDYVDLYLIHWPIAFDFKEIWRIKVSESWRALEKLYHEGKVRSIGVSNFLVEHLTYLMENCEIKPMVDQIELHVGLLQPETVLYCKANGIVNEAWAPICKGKAFDLPEVKTLSSKYNKTGAQILLRWCLQKGFIPLPKSVTPARIIENTDLFSFNLLNEDMELLNKIEAIGRLGSHPNSCNF